MSLISDTSVSVIDSFISFPFTITSVFSNIKHANFQFLLSLERTAEEYDYKIPALHDYEKYGYKNQNLTGLKNWYQDYMNKNIKTSSGYIGLPQEVYTLKPAKITDFKYSYKIEEFHEPQNIIEEIRQLFKNVINNVKNIIERVKE